MAEMATETGAPFLREVALIASWEARATWQGRVCGNRLAASGVLAATEGV